MSLLLDALKKAAEAKTRGGSEPEQAEPAPEPAAPPKVPKPAVPPPPIVHSSEPPEPFVEEDDALDDPLNDTQGQRFSQYDEFDETQQLAGDFGERTSSASYGSQKHAEVVFASKSVQTPLRAGLPTSKILIALLLVSGVAWGTYFYIQQRDTQFQRQITDIRRQTPIVPLQEQISQGEEAEQVGDAEPPATTTADSTPEATVQEEITATVAEQPEPKPEQVAEAEEPAAPETTSSSDNIDKLAESEPGQPAAETIADSPRTSAEGGNDDVSIAQNTEANAIDTVVGEAYAAYQAGDIDQAADLYDSALQREPENRDALLGRAAVHLRRQQSREALAIYQRLLALNPRDHSALAGLNALAQDENIERYESDLRFLLQETPDSTALNYALGTLLSRQKRWADAQQHFFNAFTGDPENPDIAFNLAVSLDNLGKASTAANFYRTALDLARTRASNFNQAQTQQRLQALEP